MSDTQRPKNGGDKLTAEEINGDLPVIVNAGETLTGATLPVPVYMDDTDNEVKACDADNEATLEFIGFVISNGGDGDPVTLQKDGVVDGFTGLDIGKKYYVQDAAGTIGTSKGTSEILVGVAISATQILILRGSWEFISSDAGSDTDALAQASDTSTIPALAKFIILQARAWSSEGDTEMETKAQLMLMPGIITTADFLQSTSNDDNSSGFNASTSGSTLTVITVGLTVGAGRSANIAYTAYFFK